MMAWYRERKYRAVEAFVWTGNRDCSRGIPWANEMTDPENTKYLQFADIGDYIVNVNGLIIPIKPEVFEGLYEPIKKGR